MGYDTFSKWDLYPTPPVVIDQMVGATVIQNKVVLEPSAGFGSIVDYCKNAGAKDVIACEVSPRLRDILYSKCNVIKNDFMELTSEQISHINLIIMNPPFSSQEEHILHAWDIAPEGCQIISLCNNNILSNRYSRSRSQINELITMYGNSENFGRCFNTSERQTDVEIGCIWLFKPGTGESEFDGYFDLYDYEQDVINESGIVRYDFIQDIVSRYVKAVQMFDGVEKISKEINSVISGVNDRFSIKFGAQRYGDDKNNSAIDRQIFKKELQKSAWKKLFDLFKMEKYITKGVMSDINKFVEQQVNVPFTVKNIYIMVQMIVGTHDERMGRVICEAFDKICSLSHDNSTAKEGWRTNTDFTINKKFIMPYICEYDTRWPSSQVKLDYRKSDDIEDIVKALCYLTATQYDSSYGNSLRGFINDANILWGEWAEWSFFRIKGYKKGTMHFEFLDDDLWLMFNQKVAEVRGWKNMVTHTKRKRK